tara:strand:+ start:1591 stop:1956 length:366 start_codon:yes stop_codon:yes gene_type:complete
MEIVERRENPLLDRVELDFQWDHPNEPTPSRVQMIEAAAKFEPGADKSLVFVKNVTTRFGMTRTSGMALVYGSEESASIEPRHILERHKSGDDPKEDPEPEEEVTLGDEEESQSGSEGSDE